MKHLLITGFDPFGGETVNPSWEAVSRLPDTVGDYRLTKLQIPTVFSLAARTVLDAAGDQIPDVILCIGQAGGRDAGLPGKISNTAGTFVCNDTLYRLLHHFAGTATRVGFIHVPHLPQQAKDGAPSMTQDAIIAALTAAIGALG